MEAPRKRLLMIAYACDPDGGGEHWLGWGWAELAARDHDVWLVTPRKAESAIRREAAKIGHIHPVFVEIPGWIRRSSELSSEAGSWLRKWLWQGRVRNIIGKLHSEIGFDVAHQTTFHTFRIPNGARGMGIPSVWGPLAGGESVPNGFDAYLPRTRRGEQLRSIINHLMLRLPAIRKSLEQTDILLASNTTTRNFLGSRYQEKTVVIPANSIRSEDLQKTEVVRTSNEIPTLVHVGNCVEARGMPLVFEALSDFSAGSVRLVIAGTGTALETWKSIAAKICPAGMVEFLGRIPRDEVNSLYQSADIFLFPSLRDSGGSGLLEAMTLGIPVICLDHGGPAEMLQDGAGIRIPVDKPEQTVEAIKLSIQELLRDREKARNLGKFGRERALQHFTWDGKADMMKGIYLSLTSR